MLHKGGRPNADRTPRTKGTIAKLRSTRERLRKALFHSQMKLSGRLKNLSRADILKGASQYLTKDALALFRTQLYLQPLQKFRRRWPPYFRGFARQLHFQGPRAYRYLHNFLTLPTERYLKMWLQDMAVHAGVQPAVIDELQTRLGDLEPRERVCTLMFDEMSIKQHLEYDEHTDMVYGYVDSGNERSPELAKFQALQVHGCSRLPMFFRGQVSLGVP